MGLFIGDSEPSKVFIGNTEASEIYVGDAKVRPTTLQPFGDTITIQWTEASDPTQFNPVWSDGASDAVAGDPRFDDWFGYDAVLLNTSGNVTASMSQTGGEFTGAMTALGNITSGDNVMIRFPIRGIKMTKSGNTITLSMTKKKNETGYQYYAFTRNSNIQDVLYLGAYKGSRITDGNLKKLKSWSGQSAASSKSTDGISYISLSNSTTGARAMARNNDGGNGTGTHGYEEITWYAREYINAMYMMKYGNPQSQTVIGLGYTSGSTAATTGGTNNQTSATYGATSGTQQIKLFGLEDWFGNVYEWLDGAFFNSSSNLRTSTTGTLTNSSWSGAIFDTDVTIGSSGSYLKSAVGSNTGMFAASDRSGSNSTYYCDSFAASSGYALFAGGHWDGGRSAGAFYVYGYGASDAYSYYGARLMYL